MAMLWPALWIMSGLWQYVFSLRPQNVEIKCYKIYITLVYLQHSPTCGMDISICFELCSKYIIFVSTESVDTMGLAGVRCRRHPSVVRDSLLPL